MKKDIGTTILRVGMGVLMLPHGFSKLMLLLSREEIHFPAILGLSPTFALFLTVFAELVCAFLLVIGFKTKWAAIPLIITMAIATIYVNNGGAWGNRELAVIYLIGYLAVYFMGSGRYSADKAWENFKKEQAKLQLYEY